MNTVDPPTQPIPCVGFHDSNKTQTSPQVFTSQDDKCNEVMWFENSLNEKLEDIFSDYEEEVFVKKR